MSDEKGHPITCHGLGSCRTNFCIFMDTWAQYQLKAIFLIVFQQEPSGLLKDNPRPTQQPCIALGLECNMDVMSSFLGQGRGAFLIQNGISSLVAWLSFLV